MIDEVNVVVEVGRVLGGGVDDIEVHCVVHDSRPGSGAGQLNDGFASGRLMASNVVSYSRKVRELSGVLGTRDRHPDFSFIRVGKVMERSCKLLCMYVVEDVAERTAASGPNTHSLLSSATSPIQIGLPRVP